jgi:G3E family GTPase
MDASTTRRIVAIVRDHTPLLADAPDVRRNGSVVEWPHGGVSIESDDPTATLAVLARQERRPDHVVVEADGATNPRRLGGYAYMPGYRPDGTVTVIDAATARDGLPDEMFDESRLAQLRTADVVVLNKIDVAGTDAAASAQRSLALLAPSARFLWSRRGRVAPPLLLGPTPVQSADDPTVVAQWRSDYLPIRPNERKTFAGEHSQSWCLLAEDGVESRQFRTWVGRLPTSILRGAGTVFLTEEPQHRHEFSLIGARWQLQRGAPWGGELPATRVMLVGVAGRRAQGGRGESRTEEAAESDQSRAVI